MGSAIGEFRCCPHMLCKQICNPAAGTRMSTHTLSCLCVPNPVATVKVPSSQLFLPRKTFAQYETIPTNFSLRFCYKKINKISALLAMLARSTALMQLDSIDAGWSSFSKSCWFKKHFRQRFRKGSFYQHSIALYTVLKAVCTKKELCSSQWRRCLEKNYWGDCALHAVVTAGYSLFRPYVSPFLVFHHSRCDRRRRCLLRSAWVYVWPEWLLSVISGILAGGVPGFYHPLLKAGRVPTALVCLILFCFCWVLLFFVLFVCLLFCLFWFILMGLLIGLCSGPFPALLRLPTCRRPLFFPSKSVAKKFGHHPVVVCWWQLNLGGTAHKYYINNFLS